MRRALIFLAAIPALAQFSGLSTTTDGSQLYFSSPMQLTGSTDTTSNYKIFRYDGTHFYLYATLAKVVSTAPPPDGGPTISSNYYNLGAPFVSGNGSTTGYVGSADCVNCFFPFRALAAQTTFEFAGALGELVLPGACDVNTTGRYALCQVGTVSPNDGAPVALIDLASLRSSPPTLFTNCWGNPHYITATGSVLLTQNSGLVNPAVTVWSAAAGTQSVGLAAPINGGCPMISGDGSLIVHANHAALSVFSVAKQTDTPLVANPVIGQYTYTIMLFTISDDARWMVAGIYDGSTQQLNIVDSTTGLAKQLTFGSDGIQYATLSGDGTTAYLATANGKLLKIDTRSGATQSLLGAQPVVVSYDPPVAGSFNRILGSGFPNPPQVLINGAPIPVLSSTATEIDAQIPWETPGGTATLQVTAPTAIFQQVIQLPMQTIAPTLLGQPIHQDFSGFITESSPAVGGEIVQLYFTGLGPVTPPVGDGKPAPASPLSVLTAPLQVILPGQNPVQIQYQGLAPGLFGVYQVSVQLPATIKGMTTTAPSGLMHLLLYVNGIDIPVWVQPNQ